MNIKIYNTLSRRKEEFKPIRKGRVSIYVCGPTVYDDAHIGHARSAYIFDVICRYFIHKGYNVKFVRNVTDVDDKIINKAKKEFPGADLNSAVKRVSDKYLKTYHKYMDDLGIRPPDAEPKASEYIDKMKDFITVLIQRGVAYESNGDVYFDVKKAANYGKLSNQSPRMLRSGARVSPEENKKDPLDFALWKSSGEGEPYWDSPWGRGRPGWHIECSVMSSDILGDEFDIHGGGMDLIFPHHENEIAQSEGAGKKFARYWIHNGLLTINKEKMAKSLGNFVNIEEVLNKYSADALKLLFLQTHYSHPVDFSWEKMEANKEALDTIINFLREIKKREEGHIASLGAILQNPLKRFKEKLEEVYPDFIKDMDNDFNTPNAVAVLFDIVRSGNSVLYWSGYTGEHLDDLKKARKIILEFGDILGLTFERKEKELLMPKEEIESLIAYRNEAREKKDFETADKIREKLHKRGIALEDRKGTTYWHMR